MTKIDAQISLTSASQNLADALGITHGIQSMFCKLRLQLVPGATGPFKVVSPAAEATGTAYSATGVGVFRTLTQEYFLEDQGNKNSGHLEQYNVSGAHAGDLLNVEFHPA
jgi:hypothetical protein